MCHHKTTRRWVIFIIIFFFSHPFQICIIASLSVSLTRFSRITCWHVYLKVHRLTTLQFESFIMSQGLCHVDTNLCAVFPHSQAALIMQVLQLTPEQIAMLPPEQRQSILILKEQIQKTAGAPWRLLLWCERFCFFLICPKTAYYDNYRLCEKVEHVFFCYVTERDMVNLGKCKCENLTLQLMWLQEHSHPIGQPITKSSTSVTSLLFLFSSDIFLF